jgi:transcriptional regulator with XRE-family HTH domain
VPFRSYQNWETGSREPRLQALKDLAAAFGVTTDELLADATPARLVKAPPATPPAGELEAEAKRPHKRARKGK